MISHNHHLYEELTAEENLRFAATMRGIRPERSRIRKALAEVGLETQAAWKVRTYSTGMKRRLVIGKMLLFDPELLFLDEPHNTLDQAAIALLNGYVASVRARGGSAIVATHNLSRAYDMADRFVLMREGAVDPPRREDPICRWSSCGRSTRGMRRTARKSREGRAESRACRERTGGRGEAERRAMVVAEVMRRTWAMTWKDVRVELRARERMNAMLFFAALVLFIFNFALGPDLERLREAAPGLLWLAFLFTGNARPGSELPGRARERVLRGALAHPRGPGIALLRQAGGEHPLHGDGGDS